VYVAAKVNQVEECAAEKIKVTEDLPSRIPIAWMDAFESLEMTCRKNAF
jgi:hypothetical protein